MFNRIAHVCLSVKDLQRSIEWYEKLGLGVMFEFTRKGSRFGVYTNVSESSFIELFEDPNLGPVVDNGILHFCLETEDIELTMGTLRERGVEVTDKKLGVDNTWQIWLHDPDGYRFEVHQYTARSMQLGGFSGSIEADW
jgi:lactoylglutathione lyase/glyoxylase I family protein